MACHRNRAAILDGNSEHFRLASGADRQFVAEGGNKNHRRRAAFGRRDLLGRIDLRSFVDVRTLGQQPVAPVLDVVDHLAAATVEPDVADHAVDRGLCPGRQGGVPHNGLGVGVSVVGVCEDNPFLEQVSETAFAHAVEIPPRQVAAQLVDGDLENQPRLFRFRQRGTLEQEADAGDADHGRQVRQPRN